MIRARPARGAEAVPVRLATPPPRCVRPRPSIRLIADLHIPCGREARLCGGRRGRQRASCFLHLRRNRHRPDCGMIHRAAPRKEELGPPLQPVGPDRRRCADTGRSVRYIAWSRRVSWLWGCSRNGIMTHGQKPRQFPIPHEGWMVWMVGTHAERHRHLACRLV